MVVDEGTLACLIRDAIDQSRLGTKRILTAPETAALLTIHEETLHKWRQAGRGSKWIRFEAGCSPQFIRYKLTDVREYMAALSYGSVEQPSEPAPGSRSAGELLSAKGMPHDRYS